MHFLSEVLNSFRISTQACGVVNCKIICTFKLEFNPVDHKHIRSRTNYHLNQTTILVDQSSGVVSGLPSMLGCSPTHDRDDQHGNLASERGWVERSSNGGGIRPRCSGGGGALREGWDERRLGAAAGSGQDAQARRTGGGVQPRGSGRQAAAENGTEWGERGARTEEGSGRYARAAAELCAGDGTRAGAQTAAEHGRG